MVMMNRAKIWPSGAPYRSEKATRFRFAELSMSSRDMKTMRMFRRIRTPVSPMRKSPTEEFSGGEIVAGLSYTFIHDGTTFIMVSGAVHNHTTADTVYVSDTLTAGTYTNLALDKDFYLCDCSGGDVVIESIDGGAQTGKTVIFKKSDTSANKVILKNVANGGFVETPFTSDIEIVDQYGSIEYVNI